MDPSIIIRPIGGYFVAACPGCHHAESAPTRALCSTRIIAHTSSCEQYARLQYSIVGRPTVLLAASRFGWRAPR